MNKKLVVSVVIIWALVLVAGAGVGAVLLIDGDSGSDGSSDVKPTPAADPSEMEGLDDFYDQDIAWTSCGDSECGVLLVPIDYENPADGTIELAVERTAATGDRIGSLVVNPGGPGAPGTNTARDADYYFGKELLEAYDIVGFDPRGTGDSSPVDCLSDGELDAQLAGDPDPDTPDEVAAFETGSRDFWAGCEQLSGDVAGHVSTVEAARDMDVLRSALDEDKLDYFGFSYGTRLGATYAELYPEHTGRLVLDGAVDPSISSRDGSLSQAKGFETALRSYVGNCVDAGSCFLGDSIEAGLKTIKDLIAEIDAKPLPTDDAAGRELSVGLAFYGIITPLYAEDYWVALDAGLQQALEGDGSTLLLLADSYASREDGTFADNSLEAISVINCLDDPWSIGVDEVDANLPDFEKASPTFGTIFAWGLTACHGIPFESTDEPDLVIDGSGAAPIVVIGTTRDPATPYEEAVAMADQLESGVLITRDGDGHTGYNQDNACVDDAVHAYLIEGTVPADDLKC